MEDATNYLKNLGKPKEMQRFLLSVSYEELRAIVALAQNPNPEYMQGIDSSTSDTFIDIFYSAKEILDRLDRD